MSENLERHLKNLDCLEEMWQTGRGESEEADAIRDDLDRTWRALTAQEAEQVCQHAVRGKV